jgi:hypothetical protein
VESNLPEGSRSNWLSQQAISYPLSPTRPKKKGLETLPGRCPCCGIHRPFLMQGDVGSHGLPSPRRLRLVS